MAYLARQVINTPNELLAIDLTNLGSIIGSGAFTHVFTEGAYKGHSPLFWVMASSSTSLDALRNALASLPGALKTIVSSPAFTHVIEEGPRKGQSPLFWAMFPAGPFYDSLRNALASDLNALKTIVSSPAFTHVIEEVPYKGQSPLFRAMSVSPSHDALRKALASLPNDALKTIVSSPAFTHVIKDGQCKGYSPLFWAVRPAGPFYDALRNALVSLTEDALNIIVSSPAFTHVIEEVPYKGQSPLFWAICSANPSNDALRNKLASLPGALKTIVSSPAFTHVITEGKLKGKSISSLIMRELPYFIMLKEKIMSLQKTMSLEEKYAHSENVIHRLNDFLKRFMPSSQCIISVTPSSEYHIVTEAQDNFHLEFLNNICRALKLINQKAPVTQQTCDSPVKITNTFVLAELKTPNQVDFQQLLPIREYNNVCQQTLMLIRYFMDALYSTPWEKFAVTCRLIILPHSLSPFEVCVTNFPSGINGFLTLLDLPDERIDLNRAQIEEWLERFLKKFIAFSNIGFTKDEVIKINTTIVLTLERSFNINNIDKTLALKESLRECFLSGSIKTINDEITNNIKQCQHIAFELNNQCYSIIISTFDTTKEEMFNQTTFSACFARLPLEGLDSLQQDITAITETAQFKEKFEKARGEVKGSIEKVKESLAFIVQIDDYSKYCLELLNRLIHDINTFHAQRISQTNNQCWYISTQQQRILRKITITTEDEKTLEKLNEQVIDAQNELNAIAFSFLNTQTTTLTYLKQRYDQLKKIPIGQHFKKLQDDWEEVKKDGFFKPVCTLPKATPASAATAKRVQVEQPKFEMPAPEEDYTKILEHLEKLHKQELHEEQQKRRNEKAQKANALELERQQVLKKPSSPPRPSSPPCAAMSPVSALLTRRYPVVINGALSFEQGEHIKSTCQSQTTNYAPYFTFLNDRLNALIASNQTHPEPSLHLLNAYGFLLALLSLLSEATLYTELPQHTGGLIHLKTFASHLCHVEIVDVVEMCALNQNPQYIPFFQQRLRLIWGALNEAWNCTTAQQYLDASQLLPLIQDYVRIENTFSSVLNKQHGSVVTFLKARNIIAHDEVVVPTREEMAMGVALGYKLKLEALDMASVTLLFQKLQEQKDFGALFTLSLFARELNRIYDYLFLMERFNGELAQQTQQKISRIHIPRPASLTPLTQLHYQEFANKLRHITNLSATGDFVGAALSMLFKG